MDRVALDNKAKSLKQENVLLKKQIEQLQGKLNSFDGRASNRSRQNKRQNSANFSQKPTIWSLLKENSPQCLLWDQQKQNGTSKQGQTADKMASNHH